MKEENKIPTYEIADSEYSNEMKSLLDIPANTKIKRTDKDGNEYYVFMSEITKRNLLIKYLEKKKNALIEEVTWHMNDMINIIKDQIKL
jgi:hypothetical protein